MFYESFLGDLVLILSRISSFIKWDYFPGHYVEKKDYA